MTRREYESWLIERNYVLSRENKVEWAVIAWMQGHDLLHGKVEYETIYLPNKIQIRFSTGDTIEIPVNGVLEPAQ